jgi:hypothetical protein
MMKKDVAQLYWKIYQLYKKGVSLKKERCRDIIREIEGFGGGFRPDLLDEKIIRIYKKEDAFSFLISKGDAYILTDPLKPGSILATSDSLLKLNPWDLDGKLHKLGFQCDLFSTFLFWLSEPSEQIKVAHESFYHDGCCITSAPYGVDEVAAVINFDYTNKSDSVLKAIIKASSSLCEYLEYWQYRDEKGNLLPH